MKHEVTSLNTKKLLAASLKKLISQKSFSKITVSEIIEDCKLNRKTFYYHFEDIFSLLRWTLEQEAIEVVKQFDLLVEYEEAILFVMDYVEQNNAMLNNIYDSIGRDELKRFFYVDFIGISRMIVDTAEQVIGLSIPEDYKVFVCQFYTQAISGILLEWITNRAARNREKTLQYISVLLRSTIPTALAAARQLPEDGIEK